MNMERVHSRRRTLCRSLYMCTHLRCSRQSPSPPNILALTIAAERQTRQRCDVQTLKRNESGYSPYLRRCRRHAQ